MSGDPANAAQALMNLHYEFSTPVIEAAAGHRAACEAAGFSPTAAELMAVELHKTMFAVLLHNLTKETETP